MSEVKYPALKGLIVAKYGSVGKFADALGCDIATVSTRLHGTRSFTAKDIAKWRELLKIPKAKLHLYFF